MYNWSGRQLASFARRSSATTADSFFPACQIQVELSCQGPNLRWAPQVPKSGWGGSSGLKIGLVWPTNGSNFGFKLKSQSIKRSLFTTSKNGSSIITSKNLSNENKHTLCFQRIGNLDHVLSWRQLKHNCLVSLSEILWRTFWRNNWQSILWRCKKTPLSSLT